ncbi:hypothetical protein TRFO_12593 [Tritrichomonas foetus]|uniref:magnesium chelatase n=1 Tax=Tritrichomonas foetus TaxID=1144522 RepID=A0A1J4L5L8_9EUKA|nr:hypothetical protein TRFO_12593 [Tritrichomonas foetus]|eukprot:OHT17245.1 hypothetical protein TRFO_12593 [Tritrichomonas foetus]
MTNAAKVIFENILPGIDQVSNPQYRAMVSTLVTALKREEHVLISSPSSIDERGIAQLIEYIVCSIFPATVAVLTKDGSTRLIGKRARHMSKNSKDDTGISYDSISPFLSNVCIVECFDKISDASPIIKVMRELAVTIDDHSESVPIPFLLIALVNEKSHLPRNTLGAFSFHINIQSLPSTISRIESVLYQGYDSFLQALSAQVFSHRDITTYISQLVLNVDCKPLITSFIEVKTKLLLNKAIDDCAILSGRDFVMPDDVQEIFPMLVTHKFLLPGHTNFRNCLNFVQKLIDTIPVPI